ncbi:MAG TPA: MarR family transcriptional regulator [Miltoncostaeaceae bacterium]|nr:MarR family transcriptional regulator [Miltoncostaeaceae bacterium]
MTEHHPAEGPPAGVGAAAAQVLLAGAELANLFDRLLRREGGVNLTQYQVLSLLAAAEDPQEPWQIAAALRLSSAHVTLVLDGLERGRLAARGPHPRDRRRRLVTLTGAGAERLAHLRAHVAALETRLLAAAFTAEEQATLHGMMRRLRGAMADLVVPDIRPQVGP